MRHRFSDHKPPTTEPTPFEFAKLLEGRLALEFPAEVIKEEKVSESYDKGTARYVVVWYNEDSAGKAVDLESRVNKLSSEVLDPDAKPWFKVEVTKASRSSVTTQVMVTYSLKEQPALTTKAAAEPVPETNLEAVLTLSVGAKQYQVVSRDSGTSWEVIDEQGATLEDDLPNVPAALARLLKYAFVDLSYAEEVSGGKSTEKALGDLDRNFLASWASWFANSPVVTKEAKKHLTAFVELVTKHDFKPDKEEGGEES